MSGTMKQRYVAEAIPALKSEFGYQNAMQVPRLEKIVVNIGLGEALTNSKAVDAAVGERRAHDRKGQQRDDRLDDDPRGAESRVRHGPECITCGNTNAMMSPGRT